MFGPNAVNVKVAETRTRDDIRRAERARAGAETRRARGRVPRTDWAAIAAATRSDSGSVFTRWTLRRRRVVATSG